MMIMISWSLSWCSWWRFWLLYWGEDDTKSLSLMMTIYQVRTVRSWRWGRVNIKQPNLNYLIYQIAHAIIIIIIIMTINITEAEPPNKSLLCIILIFFIGSSDTFIHSQSDYWQYSLGSQTHRITKSFLFNILFHISAHHHHLGQCWPFSSSGQSGKRDQLITPWRSQCTPLPSSSSSSSSLSSSLSLSSSSSLSSS